MDFRTCLLAPKSPFVCLYYLSDYLILSPFFIPNHFVWEELNSEIMKIVWSLFAVAKLSEEARSCSNSEECGNGWMCNFDNGASGAPVATQQSNCRQIVPSWKWFVTFVHWLKIYRQLVLCYLLFFYKCPWKRYFTINYYDWQITLCWRFISFRLGQLQNRSLISHPESGAANDGDDEWQRGPKYRVEDLWNKDFNLINLLLIWIIFIKIIIS